MKRNLLFSLAIFSVAFGVEHLSIEDVFRATLEHNHSLILSRHSEESAQRSAEFLNSGLLPTAGISAGLTYTNGSSGVDKTTSSAGLQVSYTLFDGFYTINSYRLNREKAELSAIQTKALADLTLLQSATAYLAVQSAEQSLKIAVNFRCNGTRLFQNGLSLGKEVRWINSLLRWICAVTVLHFCKQ